MPQPFDAVMTAISARFAVGTSADIESHIARSLQEVEFERTGKPKT